MDVSDPRPEGDGDNASANARDGISRLNGQGSSRGHGVEDDGGVRPSERGNFQTRADGGQVGGGWPTGDEHQVRQATSRQRSSGSVWSGVDEREAHVPAPEGLEGPPEPRGVNGRHQRRLTIPEVMPSDGRALRVQVGDGRPPAFLLVGDGHCRGQGRLAEC